MTKLVENLITSARSTGINYIGLNELVNMIYNFMSLGNILVLIFVFLKQNKTKPFLLCYDIRQVDKVLLCKKRGNIYLFLSTWLILPGAYACLKD